MSTAFKNFYTGLIALVVGFPFLVFFDVAINGVLNPKYGYLSGVFLNNEMAIFFSVILFVFSVVVPMRVHSFIIARLKY